MQTFNFPPRYQVQLLRDDGITLHLTNQPSKRQSLGVKIFTFLYSTVSELSFHAKLDTGDLLLVSTPRLSK